MPPAEASKKLPTSVFVYKAFVRFSDSAEVTAH